MATLDEFIGNEMEDHEMLVYSNWMTQFRHACEKVGIDPDELMERGIKIKKRKRKWKRKRKNY